MIVTAEQSNRPNMVCFVKWKTLSCFIISICLLAMQLYIIITANNLITIYYNYYYCLRDERGWIINCHNINSLPFSLYRKTQILHILNIISLACTLVIYTVLSAFIYRENITNELVLRLVLYSIIASCVFAVIVNAWHTIDIHTITDDEIKLWKSIDEKFILQYDTVKLFIVIHIGNMILACI